MNQHDTPQPQLLALAGSLLAPVFRASLSSPHRDLNRRLFKYTEELGEVAQVFNDLTGSRHKGFTARDLMEEKTDLFLVSTDTLVQHASVHRQGALDSVTQDLTRELALMLDFDKGSYVQGDTEHFMRQIPVQLGRAMFDLQGEDPGIQRLSLEELQRFTTLLLLTPEPWHEYGEFYAPMMQARLKDIENFIKVKVEKWQTMRQLPNAA